MVACTPLFFDEDPPNSKAATFEEFWKGIDETWPEFANKNVNWDSMYNVYHPLVSDPNSPHQLTSIFQQMVNHLKDGHTGVYMKQGTGVTYIGYKPTIEENFYGIQWIRSHYLNDQQTNGIISYQKLNSEVGYVYINDFMSSLDKYSIIDEIIRAFDGVKGIIIDVRGNGGGGSRQANMIASRFIVQNTTYGYSRYRTGRSRTAMSDFVPFELESDGAERFLGKVIVLTNRQTYSAAELFVLSMRASGHVIVMGDNTGSGSGTNPILKELPNGWTYRVSSVLLCDLSKQPISDGVVPDIRVSTLQTDNVLGKDTIIEAAIAEILK